jgi:hypothetical protein
MHIVLSFVEGCFQVNLGSVPKHQRKCIKKNVFLGEEVKMNEVVAM